MFPQTTLPTPDHIGHSCRVEICQGRARRPLLDLSPAASAGLLTPTQLHQVSKHSKPSQPLLLSVSIAFVGDAGLPQVTEVKHSAWQLQSRE